MRIYKYEGCLPLVFDRAAIGQMWKIQIHMGILWVELSEAGNRQNEETRPPQHENLLYDLESRESAEPDAELTLIRDDYSTESRGEARTAISRQLSSRRRERRPACLPSHNCPHCRRIR